MARHDRKKQTVVINERPINWTMWINTVLLIGLYVLYFYGK